jgi:GntR family transcriptional repressor for pyruvate dehydrogenase complex
MSARPSLVQPIKIARAYDQLAGLLRERITSGDLRVGDRLPSESALAEQAGVSRSTVREALRILEQGGLVERASPRIMVVADRSEGPGFRELRSALRQHNVTFHHLHEAMMTLDPELTRFAAQRADRSEGPGFRELRSALRQHNVTFHHLHEAMMTLDPELTRFAAQRADRSDVKELNEALEAQEEHLGHLAEWSRLDVEFHSMLAEIAANPALVIAREPISQLLMPALYRFMDTRDMAEHATKYHRRIVEEIEVRDPDTAAAVMRRHINDWRTAWERRGLDLHQEIIDFSSTDGGEPHSVEPTGSNEEERWDSSRAPRRSPV